MSRQIFAFLLSLLVPGFGYLLTGNKKKFYTTISIFFMVVMSGTIFRMFIFFWGLLTISLALIVLYFFTAMQAVIKVRAGHPKIYNVRFLQLFFTIFFIFITGFSFANRRIVMGFDMLSMNVQVMEPTVLNGDKFLIDTWAYKWGSTPQRRDIIAHSFNQQQGLYLNRIIAIGNDKVEIKNGIVFLNGQILNEPYILSANVKRLQSKDMKAITIPNGHYFVMGDNRDASFGDSRFNGLITVDNIVGRATDVIYSREKLRRHIL